MNIYFWAKSVSQTVDSIAIMIQSKKVFDKRNGELAEKKKL